MYKTKLVLRAYIFILVILCKLQTCYKTIYFIPDNKLNMNNMYSKIIIEKKNLTIEESDDIVTVLKEL